MRKRSGELWRNRMHRVVIHLCSPLLCQTSWLQRQLLKDGIILITIFVGIVSVQHQVLKISLSHGIVTMPELVYRMLVTLLYVSKQWGNSNATNQDTTVTFPIAFSVLYSVVGVPKSSSFLSGSNSNFGVKSQNNWSFIANMYDNGRGYAGFNWCAFGKN